MNIPTKHPTILERFTQDLLVDDLTVIHPALTHEEQTAFVEDVIAMKQQCIDANTGKWETEKR